MVQNIVQKPTQKAPNNGTLRYALKEHRCGHRGSRKCVTMGFGVHFRSSKMSPNGTQNGTHIRSKTCHWPPEAPQGCQRPLGGLQRVMLEPFEVNCGPFWSNVGTIWVSSLHLHQFSFCSFDRVLVLGASQLLRVGGCPR